MDDFRLTPNTPPTDPLGEPRSSFITDRRLLTFLILFVAAGLIFGVMRIRSGILSPFVIPATEEKNTEEALNERLIALASKDTDSDGINDFQELYQTGTSPYLSDSDSDDIQDRAEIEAGTNPNCPEGQNCTSFLPAEDITTNTNQANTNASTGVNPDEQITASAIRETLKSSGAPEYLLDATSDEELLNIYQEISGGATTTANTNAADTASTLETLQNFTPSDIREMLVSTGADASLLEQVSDADLQEIFNQALQEDASLFTENSPSP